MAAPNSASEPSKVAAPSKVVYGLVNNRLIRRELVTVEIYPELLHMVREIGVMLDVIYEKGVRKGMELERESLERDESAQDSEEIFQDSDESAQVSDEHAQDSHECPMSMYVTVALLSISTVHDILISQRIS